MKDIFKIYGLFVVLTFACAGCGKDFLEAKPNSNIDVPSTLDDLQKILDNNYVFNSNFCALGQLSSDEYFYNYDAWVSNGDVVQRNAYVWADDIYGGTSQNEDWNSGFASIYASNVILNALPGIKITGANAGLWNDLKAKALFFRGYRYYDLAETFVMPYNPLSAEKALGLPLRTNPDIDEIVQRSSLKATYEMILNDVKSSIPLFSQLLPGQSRNRPSKAAAYALLSKVYLNMGDYDNALLFSDSCLSLYSKLIDYNEITPAPYNSFSDQNPEVILWALMTPYLSIQAGGVFPDSNVDTVLYKLYEDDDLRKAIFFTVNDQLNVNVNCIYNSIYTQPFSGLATDEIYLIKAECLSRSGRWQEGMAVLNVMLQKRWMVGTFEDKVASSEEDAMAVILSERRKQLVFRGARWADARRLNNKGMNITFSRFLNGTKYELLPNSPKYALPIPNSEISLSGISQNPR